MTTYMITGASGALGTLAVQALAAKVPASDIIALVRRPEAAAPLEALGVQTRIASYDEPEALGQALQGVDRLLLVSGTDFGKRAIQHANVIDAARTAGVGFIAYTSVLKAGTSALMVAPDHVATEDYLSKAGIPHALLRNGWYTENYTAGLAPALEHGAIIGAAGEAVIAPATRADYAAAAAAVLSEGREGTFELAGSERLTMTEYAALVSEVAGKTVPYVDMSEAEYVAALIGAGLPEPVARLLATSDTAAKTGDLDHDGTTLESLIGRKSTPVKDAITAVIG